MEIKNVFRILLLYNILTMLNSEKDNSYFPFDIFKNEKWDIEPYYIGERCNTR